MVAPKHDDGVVAQAERVEFRDDASDLRVNEAHAAGIGVEQWARRYGVDRPGRGHTGAGLQFERSMPRDCRGALLRLGCGGERQRGRSSEIEVFRGGDEA